MDRFCKGYYRYLHVVVEKQSFFATVKSVCERYVIPCSCLRGQASESAVHAIAEEYRQSGKGGFDLIVLSDFDPAGERVASSIAKRLRDDFGIDAINAVKAAVTVEQAEDLDLLDDTKGIEVKKKDGQREAFFAKYGADQKGYEVGGVPSGRAAEARCRRDRQRDRHRAVQQRTRGLEARRSWPAGVA